MVHHLLLLFKRLTVMIVVLDCVFVWSVLGISARQALTGDVEACQVEFLYRLTAVGAASTIIFLLKWCQGLGRPVLYLRQLL